MIRNDIISSRDMPDEFHQKFADLTDEVIDALTKVAESHGPEDGRMFLGAINLAYAGMLAVFMESMGETIEREDYLERELEVFIRNFQGYEERIKKTPGV